MSVPSSPLVSTAWLAQHLHAPNLKIVDASWYMPAAQRDCFAEFAAAHIPGAVFFDLDTYSDHSTDLPHMLPSAEKFAAIMGEFGIGNADIVVIYDTAGLFSAARLWWMLQVFGHNNAAVLDGGLPKWLAENHPTESGAPTPEPAQYSAYMKPQLVRDKTALQNNTTALVLDARSAARFAGTAPEPRAGLRSGHIPASRNVPFTSLLNADGTFKPAAELAQILDVENGQPVISSCGSGVTACIIDLALEIIGHRNHAVYDGSWAEWGADPACPVATNKE